VKWKNVKFWIWIEVFFPAQTFSLEEDGLEGFRVQHNEFLVHLGAGAQGVQSGICGPEPVDSPVCFDVLNFSSEFELNGIPTAVVGIPLGRRGDDVTKISEIHRYIDQLQLQLRCKVWCRATTNAGTGIDITDPSTVEAAEALWPASEFVIFEGYITGSGFRRGNGGAELTLSLTHWLADLNFSSALSKQSHPLNPSQMYFEANFVNEAELSAGSFTSGTGPMQTGAHLAMPYFTSDTVITDLWGGIDGTSVPKSGLRNWLLYLTQRDRINKTQINNLVGGGPAGDLDPGKNWEACRAITRFEPDDDGYQLGVPLGMSSQGDLNANIANNIGQEIGNETLEAYSNVTLWDKLAGQFHANYMFSIVPLVQKALVVPFVPGLRGSTHRVLWARNYESLDLTATMPRPLRAVGLIIGKNFNSGGGMSRDGHPAYSGFGGWFDKMTTSDDPRYKEGLVMFKQAPRWLTMVTYYTYSRSSAAVTPNVTLRTTTAPNAGAPHSDTPPDEVLNQSQTIWNLYARTLYIHEVLKNRQGAITGPVRFDIAPGSQLKVEVTEDKWVQQILREQDGIPICDDSRYMFMYCSVLRVSTTIDCQNGRALTSFYVAHVRNAQENTDDATSIDRHPIWQRCMWHGCSLVIDPAFEPLTTQSCTG
jgi:hypothetical protein